MNFSLEAILLWCLPGFLGGFGGVIAYISKLTTKNRFSAGMFITKFLTAFFVGRAFGYFFPVTSEVHYGYIMVLGFAASPVIAILEEKAKAWASRLSPPGAS